MLLREGTSKGNEPSVMVLEVAQHQDRKADDLLPYLGAFAKFFRKLPNDPNDLILKSELVLLSDIECFTKSIIDIPQSAQNLSRRKGESDHSLTNILLLNKLTDTLKLAQAQFLPLCQSWDYQDWDEYDYGRINNLKFRELEDLRRKVGQDAANKDCLKCPEFLKHASRPRRYVTFDILTCSVCHGARSMAYPRKYPGAPPTHVRPEFTAITRL